MKEVQVQLEAVEKNGGVVDFSTNGPCRKVWKSLASNDRRTPVVLSEHIPVLTHVRMSVHMMILNMLTIVVQSPRRDISNVELTGHSFTYSAAKQPWKLRLNLHVYMTGKMFLQGKATGAYCGTKRSSAV